MVGWSSGKRARLARGLVKRASALAVPNGVTPPRPRGNSRSTTCERGGDRAADGTEPEARSCPMETRNVGRGGSRVTVYNQKNTKSINPLRAAQTGKPGPGKVTSPGWSLECPGWSLFLVPPPASGAAEQRPAIKAAKASPRASTPPTTIRRRDSPALPVRAPCSVVPGPLEPLASSPRRTDAPLGVFQR